jgi:hypothetical protein
MLNKQNIYSVMWRKKGYVFIFIGLKFYLFTFYLFYTLFEYIE